MKRLIRLFVNLLVPAFVLEGVATSPAMAQDKAKDAKAVAGNYQLKKLFENDKVVVTENLTKPGGESESRVRNYFRVVRVLRGGTTERTWADGKKEVRNPKTGDVYAEGPDTMAFKTKNIGKTDVVIYVVRLKEPKK
jgi:hypothetical protein